MELELLRAYHPTGTNGKLINRGDFICNTIELPWLGNMPRQSCIPEGRYEIRKRFSEKYQWHLEILNVPKRKFILLHPANNALKELKGCIAPVEILTAPGKGLKSRIALNKLKRLVYPVLENNQKVFLTIKIENHESIV